MSSIIKGLGGKKPKPPAPEKFVDKSSLFRKLLEGHPLLKPILDKFRPVPLTPREFILELQSQIVNAERGTHVFIYTPYIDEEGLEYFSGILKTALDRGVRITVYTLSPEHWTIKNKELQKKLIDKLREDVKVEVKVRRIMHEKAVIILGPKTRIAYIGSMSTFSRYKEGTDYMLRITQPEIVEAMYLLLENISETSENIPE